MVLAHYPLSSCIGIFRKRKVTLLCLCPGMRRSDQFSASSTGAHFVKRGLQEQLLAMVRGLIQLKSTAASKKKLHIVIIKLSCIRQHNN